MLRKMLHDTHNKLQIYNFPQECRITSSGWYKLFLVHFFLSIKLLLFDNYGQPPFCIFCKICAIRCQLREKSFYDSHPSIFTDSTRKVMFSQVSVHGAGGEGAGDTVDGVLTLTR